MTVAFDPTGVLVANLITNEVINSITEPDIVPTQGPFYTSGLTVYGSPVSGGSPIQLTEYADFIYSPLFSVRSGQTGKEVYSYILLTNYTNWSNITLTYHAVGGGNDPILAAEITAAGVFDRTLIDNWLLFTGDAAVLNNPTLNLDLNNTNVTNLFTNKLQAIADSLGTPSTYLTFINSSFANAQTDIATLKTQVNSWNTTLSNSGILSGSFATTTWVTAQLNNAVGSFNTISGIIKGNGSGAFSAAVANTDYVTPTALTNAISGLSLGTASSQSASAFDAAGAANAAATAALNAAKAYTDAAGLNTVNDRGGYNASTNLFPVTGGSGTTGTVKKGDMWTLTVAGTLNSVTEPVGTVIRALIDAPGQTATNWLVIPSALNYTSENVSNKVTSATYSADYNSGSPSDTHYPTIASVYSWVTSYLNTYITNTALATALSNYTNTLSLNNILTGYATNSVIQSGSLVTAPAGGTSDAITATFTPAITTLYDGMLLAVRAGAVNTTTTPTFAANATTAHTIVKGANLPLALGDITGPGHRLLLQWDGTLNKWVLQNPGHGIITPSSQLTALSVTANSSTHTLTISVPSTVLDFRSSTLTDGSTIPNVSVNVTPLVIPSTATLGTQNSSVVASNRFIVLIAYNAGSPVLCVANASGGLKLDESNLLTTAPTIISTAATSANVVYSQAAVVANSQYRVVGYFDIAETTAGTWDSSPTLVQPIGGQDITNIANVTSGRTLQHIGTGGTLIRALNTTYYNTTGQDILVTVSANNGAAGGSISAAVDGYTNVGSLSSVAFSTASITFAVPNGKSYLVNMNNTTGVNTWSELRN